ncbi:hypothetical protein MMC22_008403, partial [Lobaria immixta]|nr:hypothetical protein [Lobaria immixta]
MSSEDDLSLKVTSSHYAWTYGPTVILVVILSIWGQVVGLYNSLRQRHYPVVLSVAGFIVLKLVILVSTTLFVPKQTLRLEARPVQYITSFNASTLWSKIDYRNETWAATPRYGLTRADFATDVLWGYLIQLNGQAPDPTRVKDNMIFQSPMRPRVPWKAILPRQQQHHDIIHGRGSEDGEDKANAPQKSLQHRERDGFPGGLEICDPKENIIPPGSEFLRRKELARLFEGRRFSLGWWTSSAGQEVEADAEHEEVEVAASESDPFHEWHELMPR